MRFSSNQIETATACFQFTSNSIHLAASFEILEKWSHEKSFALHYYWLGASTKYPSRMSRGLDEFLSPINRFPSSISNCLDKMSLTKVQKRIRLDQIAEEEECLRALVLQLENIRSVQDFKKIEYGSIFPGGALANAFVSETGRRDFDFNRDKDVILLLLESYLRVFFGVKHEIFLHKITRALIYNGRFLHERAAWDACKLLGIDVFLFETTRNRYHLRKNEGFHDRKTNQIRMKELWISKSSELSRSEMVEIGSRYFLDLESRKNRFYQTSSLAPKAKLKSNYFVFYSNSDDEAIGFWDTWTEPFIGQIELIEKLQLFFDERKNEHLFIRLHPNLSNKSLEERKRWRHLRDSDFTTLIEPNNPTSSYELLKGSKGVISYGSTIGIEAAFHSIPSAILADCWYDELEVADKLYCLEEVYEWIRTLGIKFNPELVNDRRNRALIRGVWLELSGYSFVHCTLKELSWGSWEAERFKDSKISRPKFNVHASVLANKLKRILRGFSP